MCIPFTKSTECSLGTELELQIINPRNGNLMARAKDLIRYIQNSPFAEQIKPEITQSMIELNSAVHMSSESLLKELLAMNRYLATISQNLNLGFSGGGTHPFQVWRNRKIFPSSRFKYVFHRLGYLAKYFTVFGQHVHIGCTSGDDAIYLTQALLRYIPQLLALSASSPYYQRVDTTFASSRSNVIHAYPTSGYMIGIHSWEEFCVYYQKLCDLQVIESMKDIYWDIRPKAEYGTVEVRIFDTPLTINRAVMLAAYVQTLAHYLLQERPVISLLYDPLLYKYNRYQAGRLGIEGNFVNPYTEQSISISDDILATLKILEPHAIHLHNEAPLAQIFENVNSRYSDARWLRDTYAKVGSLQKLVFAQSQLWLENGS